MTKPIIPVPTGTRVLYLGARLDCAPVLEQTGTLTVWPAGCTHHWHDHMNGHWDAAHGYDYGYEQGWGLGYGHDDHHEHVVGLPHGSVTYTSVGIDLQGRLKFLLDDAWLRMTVPATPPFTVPSTGRWDGILTTATGTLRLRFQLGGHYHLSSFAGERGYARCEPADPCATACQ